MEYTHLGRSGLRVSRLCLGTMNFGPLTATADAHAIMDHAHEIGINFVDTANRYGGRQSPPGQIAQHEESHPGWTEEIIGDWFAAGRGRRERTVLATKLLGGVLSQEREGRSSWWCGATSRGPGWPGSSRSRCWPWRRRRSPSSPWPHARRALSPPSPPATGCRGCSSAVLRQRRPEAAPS
jgi:aryl-alcohol dehydrogenase-like predicted oxidoreductase